MFSPIWFAKETVGINCSGAFSDCWHTYSAIGMPMKTVGGGGVEKQGARPAASLGRISSVNVNLLKLVPFLKSSSQKAHSTFTSQMYFVSIAKTSSSVFTLLTIGCILSSDFSRSVFSQQDLKIFVCSCFILIARICASELKGPFSDDSNARFIVLHGRSDMQQ